MLPIQPAMPGRGQGAPPSKISKRTTGTKILHTACAFWRSTWGLDAVDPDAETEADDRPGRPGWTSPAGSRRNLSMQTREAVMAAGGYSRSRPADTVT